MAYPGNQPIPIADVSSPSAALYPSSPSTLPFLSIEGFNFQKDLSVLPSQERANSSVISTTGHLVHFDLSAVITTSTEGVLSNQALSRALFSLFPRAVPGHSSIMVGFCSSLVPTTLIGAHVPFKMPSNISLSSTAATISS